MHQIVNHTRALRLRSVLLVGLASISSQVHTVEVEAGTNRRDFWTEDRITIDPLTSSAASGIEYLLVKDGDRWTVRRPDSKQPTHMAENEELVRLRSDGVVSVVYDKGCHQGNPNSRVTECSCIKGLKGETRAKDGYGMCTSAFKTVSLGPISALSTVLATGFMGWTGSTSVVYKLDVDSIKNAVIQSGLVQQANGDLYADYQRQVANAAGIAELSGVIEKFGRMKYDPDNALPGLRQTLTGLQQQVRVAAAGLAERERVAAAELAEREARERAIAAEQQAIADAARQKEANAGRVRRQQALVQFRQGLRDGDDTFCGPVIEIKSKKMVKIAVRAQLIGYAAEQWLRVDEVYMPDQGCINTNGRLTPQSY